MTPRQGLRRFEAVDAAYTAGEVGMVVLAGTCPSLKEPLDISEPHIYLRLHPSHDRTVGAGTAAETFSARLPGPGAMGHQLVLWQL